MRAHQPPLPKPPAKFLRPTKTPLEPAPRALENDMAPVLVVATNRGITRIRGTNYRRWGLGRVCARAHAGRLAASGRRPGATSIAALQSLSRQTALAPRCNAPSCRTRLAPRSWLKPTRANKRRPTCQPPRHPHRPAGPPAHHLHRALHRARAAPHPGHPLRGGGRGGDGRRKGAAHQNRARDEPAVRHTGGQAVRVAPRARSGRQAGRGRFSGRCALTGAVAGIERASDAEDQAAPLHLLNTPPS